MPKIYCSSAACAAPNVYELTVPKFCQSCGSPFNKTQSISEILASANIRLASPSQAPAQPIYAAPKAQQPQYFSQEDMDLEKDRRAIANIREIKMDFSFIPPNKERAEDVFSSEKIGACRQIPTKITKKEAKARFEAVQSRQRTRGEHTIGGE